MYDDIIQKIREIIPDDSKTQEMFNLLTEEVFENLFAQLADVSTDEELKVYENRMNESKSPEHLQTILNEIAVTVYGDNAMDKLKDDYIALIAEVEKNINDAKGLIDRASQGDQTAIDLLNKAQQADTYKSVMEQ